MFRKRLMAGAVGFCALAVLAGCSKGGGRGPYATVSGKVTHNGAPVENAQIVFHSTVQIDGKQGLSAAAQTDSSGQYLLASTGKEPGIPPGLYKVTIVKLNAKGQLPADFDAGQMAASGMSINAMPKDYENPHTTKLSVTLEEGKNEGKNFDMKGQGGAATSANKVP